MDEHILTKIFDLFMNWLEDKENINPEYVLRWAPQIVRMNEEFALNGYWDLWVTLENNKDFVEFLEFIDGNGLLVDEIDRRKNGIYTNVLFRIMKKNRR